MPTLNAVDRDLIDRAANFIIDSLDVDPPMEEGESEERTELILGLREIVDRTGGAPYARPEFKP